MRESRDGSRIKGFFCALCFLSWFCRISDTALCTFWSRSGSFHGAAVERSGTAGGMKRVLPVEVEEGLQCGVRWVLRSGAAGMRAVRACVSWPARPAGKMSLWLLLHYPVSNGYACSPSCASRLIEMLRGHNAGRGS